MDDANLLEWTANLPRLDNYTEKDQYHDFRKVFTGDSTAVEGQRVLRRIMELGCIFNQPPLVSPIDSYMLAAIHGRRYLALKILSNVNNEPHERPTQTAKRPTKTRST